MPTKAELQDQIESWTGSRPPDDLAKIDLEKMLAELGGREAELASPQSLEDLRAPGGVTRRKVNRGSTRRINLALVKVRDALEAFAQEIDGQVWITDEHGERIAPHPLVENVRHFRARLSDEVRSFTTPIENKEPTE